ncbi:MAG: nitroreductase [Crocinitomicaceae bacterium]|nr:nitroreductase [Crocinitomicaceae bacterium]NGF76282.1 nitroreductase [Fluviicola sp. SGL-29]
MKYNLSEITELIRNRRTIFPEQYSSRKVHKEQIELIINNALWAPNHGNTQPWRFHVFTDGGLQKLSDFLGKTYLEVTPKEAQNDMKLAKMVSRPLRSSVVIAVSMVRQPESKIMELEEIEAVACAVQNMYLTCTAYGLGGFWSTPKLIYNQEMNHFLDLGEQDRCLGLFYVGYPDIEWPKAHRKPLEYVTKWISEE